MKGRVAVGSLAGLVIGVVAQIALAGSSSIARRASDVDGMPHPARQLEFMPQAYLPGVYLNDDSTIYEKTVHQKHSMEATRIDDQYSGTEQHLTNRGISNELLEAAQSRPFEAMQLATDTAGSSRLPQAERFKRTREEAGLSNEELKELESADFAHATSIKWRTQTRLQRMRAAKPDPGSAEWEDWKKDVQAKEVASGQVVERLAKMKAVHSDTGEAEKLVRPRNFVGLMKAELDRFRSQNIFQHALLSTNLSSRLSRLRTKPSMRKNQYVWQRQRDAALAWKEGVHLRELYSAEEIERQIHGVLEAATAMSPDEAAKQIPLLLRSKVHEARATSAPAPEPVPAAGKPRNTLGSFTVGTSTAANRLSTIRSRPNLEAVRPHLPPTKPLQTSAVPVSAISSDLPPWLRKALVEPGLRPESLHHLASGSGSNLGKVDAATESHAARASTQLQLPEHPAHHAKLTPMQELPQQVRQTPELLDLFH